MGVRDRRPAPVFSCMPRHVCRVIGVPSSPTIGRWILVIVVLLPLAAAACGGSSSPSIPEELVGTYTTTLRQSDLPQTPPPELVDGGLDWKLTIATSGGPDDGPVMVIESVKAGSLEAPSLEVDGDRLLLKREECFENGSYVFYDNEYRWEMVGSNLTITPVTNKCKDEIALTVLTSERWAKSG